MKKLNKFFLADLHTKGKTEGTIEGIASTWNKDLGGDQIQYGAFSDTIETFMNNPVMLFSHQMDKPIGKWTGLVETDKGLEVKGKINTNTALGKDTFELIKSNDLKGLSIGYSVQDSEAVGDTNVLKKLDLWEISIVSIPMNQQAWLTGAKMFESEPDDTFKHDDKDLDFDKLAVDMADIFRFSEKRQEDFDHLSKHYKKLDKKLPEFEGDIEDVKFKDVVWNEDEKYILELTRFKNNVISISDIVKHWQKVDRELPEDDLKVLNELLAGKFNSIGKELEAIQLRKVQSINKLSERVEALSKANTDRKVKMLDSVDTIIKEALYKATGKRI